MKSKQVESADPYTAGHALGQRDAKEGLRARYFVSNDPVPSVKLRGGHCSVDHVPPEGLDRARGYLDGYSRG